MCPASEVACLHMSRVSVSGLKVLVAQLLQHTRVPRKYLLMAPVFVEGMGADLAVGSCEGLCNC